MIPILSGNMHSLFEQVCVEHLAYVRHHCRCSHQAEEMPVLVGYTVYCKEIVFKKNFVNIPNTNKQDVSNENRTSDVIMTGCFRRDDQTL